MRCAPIFLIAVLLFFAATAQSAGIPTLDPVEVMASKAGLSGSADSANQGTVVRQQLEARPVYRAGEILEHVPGLVVTQHSGEGKANQYFLRGFNLDHGTDFAVTVDGVPVNMRTHGHGQGYSDLSFLIPELVGGLQYRKGTYYAEEGDFSAAGAARIRLLDDLGAGIAEVGIGGQGYKRMLLADSPQLGAGRVLYALEVFGNDGPWTRPDDYRKVNAVLRYSQGSNENGFNVTAMAYRGTWNSTDQIAKRAVESGQIGRFDTLDPTDGGRSHRYALSAAWRRAQGDTRSEATIYVLRSDLQLFSNFTYFMQDPVNGDQFEQNDRRIVFGANVKHTWAANWGGVDVANSVGLQLRNDHIDVGLFGTRARQRLTVTRNDRVIETSGGAFFENVAYLTPYFRTVAGLRADSFTADVNSDNAVNSGRANDHLVSPKLSLVLGPWAETELYLNYGRGFHSNDARGTTITVEPKTGNPAQSVPFLVRATGYEAGVRSAIVPRLQTSFSLFQLNVDSELLFVGDAGSTEPSRPSRRTGFELSNLYTPTAWLTLDADIAFSHARFRDPDPAGSRIPGAVQGVATFDAAVDRIGPYYGSLRLRYFGRRPLIENNTVRSASTTLLSGRIGYRWSKKLRAQLDGFNLLNRRVSQIDYLYESQLRGEAAPVADVHFHPAEPRSFRASLIANF